MASRGHAVTWAGIVTAALAFGSGCVTAWQDGHRDACKHVKQYGDPASSAVFDHDQANSGSGCIYDNLPIGLVPDPDDLNEYDHGLIAGGRACWQDDYDGAWFAADAARPCAEVYGDPLPAEAR